MAHWATNLQQVSGAAKMIVDYATLPPLKTTSELLFQLSLEAWEQG